MTERIHSSPSSWSAAIALTTELTTAITTAMMMISSPPPKMNNTFMGFSYFFMSHVTVCVRFGSWDPLDPRYYHIIPFPNVNQFAKSPGTTSKKPRKHWQKVPPVIDFGVFS